MYEEQHPPEDARGKPVETEAEEMFVDDGNVEAKASRLLGPLGIKDAEITTAGMTIQLVDPGTTALAIIGLIEGILKWKSGNEQGKWLTELVGKFDEILDKLEEIVDILRDMKVFFKQELKGAFVNDLEKHVFAVAERYLAERKSYPGNATYAKKSASELLAVLGVVPGRLRQYGYAPFQSVATAMLLEADLLHYAGKPDATRKAIFDSYKGYFTKAGDVSVRQSLAHAEDSAGDGAKERKDWLKANAKTGTRKTGHEGCGNGLYDFYLDITGGGKAPYSVSNFRWVLVGRKQRDRDRHDRGGRDFSLMQSDRAVAKAGAENRLDVVLRSNDDGGTESVLRALRSDCVAKNLSHYMGQYWNPYALTIVPGWNRKRSELIELTARQHLLKQFVKQDKALVDLADQYMRNPDRDFTP